ncbi:hypothetical protein D3260_15125 [Salinisphaera sp. Q1T1-3]|nr:hypothetical protein D3260_15125 [Salinisphaera sp. Q1T1-3]
MSPNGLFHWVGEQIGRLIRAIVDGLAWFFGHIFGAIDSFYGGLADELGIGRSMTALIILVIGLVLLLSGLRHAMRRRLVSGLLIGGLGVLLLGWLIH